MHNIFLALSLLTPLFSLAQYTPLILEPTLTTTLYVALTPSISTVSDTVTSTPTSPQASLFPAPPA